MQSSVVNNKKLFYLFLLKDKNIIGITYRRKLPKTQPFLICVRRTPTILYLPTHYNNLVKLAILYANSMDEAFNKLSLTFKELIIKNIGAISNL